MVVLFFGCISCTTEGAVSRSPAFPEALQGKLIVDESGNYRIMSVVRWVPHPFIQDPDFPSIPVPRGSPTWDCDDDALYMYNYLINEDTGGFKEEQVIPVIGNLDTQNEDVLNLECDHIWVMLKIREEDCPAYAWDESSFVNQYYKGQPLLYTKGGFWLVYDSGKGNYMVLYAEGSFWLAYDWGEPCFDEQHYEGCPITYEELLQAVEYDKE